MLERINILKVIVDHFGTLKSLNQRSKYINWKDAILFLAFPMLISITLTYNEFDFKGQLGNLIAAIAIFGGFLFNLLAIIYSQIDNIKKDADNENNELKQKFVKEIHVNISFCIVLSIFLILTLLTSTVYIPNWHYKWVIEKTIIGINYFLLTLFLLTLIMVINRVYILLNKTIE